MRYKQAFVIPKARVDRVFQEAIRGCRQRMSIVDLPFEESFRVEYVTGKSWSGYNWYQGNFKSLIQVNTDLPIYIDRAIDLACHEGYPGHHVYNVLLEKNLVKDRGWIEFTVYPLFSPQSLIAEGTANYGIEVAFPLPDRVTLRAGRAVSAGRPRSGEGRRLLRSARPGRSAVVCRQRGGAASTSTVRSTAKARWRGWRSTRCIRRPRAEQRVRFIDQYRSYVINYNLGKDLVRAYIERKMGRDRDAAAPLERIHGAAVVAAFAVGAQVKVVEISQPGPPDVLKLAERPDPVPAAGEVLIDVDAAGVESSGRAAAARQVPAAARRLRHSRPRSGRHGSPRWVEASPASPIGDRVCALVAGGGYAERAAVPQEQVLPIPKGLTGIQAAGIPETFFTVWTNVFQRGKLKYSESILIHGGTSGIGTTAIQLARAFGAQVLTTAGSDEKCEAARKLGAAHAFNYRTTDWVAEAKRVTNGRGVDVILDIVGGDYMSRNLDLLAVEGRLLQIAFLKTRESGARLFGDDAEARVDYRIDAAPAVAGGEGRDRARPSRARVAAARAGRGGARHS